MRSLFVKVFLCFWATVILTGIAMVMTFVLRPGAIPQRWHAMLAETARASATLAVSEMERAGPSAVASFLANMRRESHIQACLFDDSANSLAGENCASFEAAAKRVASSRTSHFGLRFGIARVAMVVRGNSGRSYIFATELPAGPRAAVGMNAHGFLLQWGVAFLVSGLICYLLTRYITVPVVQLRTASRQLAEGNLSSRAAPGMEHRHDELGGLVRDFNSMADRIEQLIATQRQLVYDISHEIRSPLARLNVALDLARERKGDDPAFAHMEQDLGRVDEMLERMLTIARLDTSASGITMTLLDVCEVVSRIVSDARFEVQEPKHALELDGNPGCMVQGNGELLHSAIENVVRNAIRYAPAKSPVEVHIACSDDEAIIAVRDHGPGVPESDLRKIFQPFYRVAHARDSESGGTGLGLAIAERIVRIHRGKIEAENVAGGGLRVKITLPLSKVSQPAPRS